MVDRERGRLLLGRKKRGFGEGKLNGFGGKIEAGESEAQAAVREIREETGLQIEESLLRPAGRILFFFPFEPAFDHEVHLFVIDTWAGDPIETAEMAPEWFDLDRIPYDEMWADDPHWMPLVLAGRTIDATFTFAEDNETVASFEIRELAPDETSS